MFFEFSVGIAMATGRRGTWKIKRVGWKAVAKETTFKRLQTMNTSENLTIPPTGRTTSGSTRCRCSAASGSAASPTSPSAPPLTFSAAGGNSTGRTTSGRFSDVLVCASADLVDCRKNLDSFVFFLREQGVAEQKKLLLLKGGMETFFGETSLVN